MQGGVKGVVKLDLPASKCLRVIAAVDLLLAKPYGVGSTKSGRSASSFSQFVQAARPHRGGFETAIHQRQGRVRHWIPPQKRPSITRFLWVRPIRWRDKRAARICVEPRRCFPVSRESALKDFSRQPAPGPRSM